MIIQAQKTQNKQHYQIFIRGEWFASILPENLYQTYHLQFLIALNNDLDINAINCVQRDRAYKFIDYLCKNNSPEEFTDKLKHLLPMLHICLRYSLYEEYAKTIADYYTHIRPLVIHGNIKQLAA
jgi:hypothetical protein